MAHLKDSVSFPLDLCDEYFFMKWDTNVIMKDIIKNKEKGLLFKNRKRLFINIIVGQEDIQPLLNLAPMVFHDIKDQKSSMSLMTGQKQNL